MLDIVIIGSGPAGLTAAIYATRAKLDLLVIEENFVSGGQVINTYEVDNYPGLPGINGFDLAMKMREHAEKLGAVFVNEKVTEVSLYGAVKTVKTEDNTYEAKTVLIATGASHRKLGCPGEEEFAGKGVSYCATCDGAFYRDKAVAVMGGGNTAIEDAIFLSRLCSRVYVIHRRDELRADRALQEKLFAAENVEMVWSGVISSIEGDEKVGIVRVRSTKDGSERTIEVSGVFVAVGIVPLSGLFASQVETDEAGYIVAGEDGETNIPGVFAVGDVRTKNLRQIITAASDGANAVTSAEKYLNTCS
ncbi:MAG: thioredoxin-disulfide reductase [Lachnospiraceae bacterium]|nr:thioredoxin-disulfide reductase [Lachnospiraceae bacterium]